MSESNQVKWVGVRPTDPASNPIPVDVSDDWARQLGQIDLARVLGAALSVTNPVIVGLYDALGNRMPSMDTAARPGYVDVIDRAARLVGIVYGESAQLQQLTPADSLTPNLSLEVTDFLHAYDAVAGDWNRVREGATLGSILTDMADRATRLVGIVYGESAQLQQLTPADSLTPNLSLETTDFLHVYDAVAGDWNRVREGATLGSVLTDMVDRATRLVGIVYGETAQLQQLTPADAVTPANSLEVAGFPHVYDSVAGDWNRLREGAAIGQMLTDPADRATRLLGVIYGSQAQQLQQRALTFEALVQLNQAGAEVAAGNPLPVQDTGLNTNPRRYEKDNGFVTNVMGIPVANTPVTIWGVGVGAINPAGGRTAGEDSTVYTFDIINRTGGTALAWLEAGGVRFTVEFHINNGETFSKNWDAGINFGNTDVQINSNVSGLSMQITGTEA